MNSRQDQKWSREAQGSISCPWCQPQPLSAHCLSACTWLCSLGNHFNQQSTQCNMVTAHNYGVFSVTNDLGRRQRSKLGDKSQGVVVWTQEPPPSMNTHEFHIFAQLTQRTEAHPTENSLPNTVLMESFLNVWFLSLPICLKKAFPTLTEVIEILCWIYREASIQTTAPYYIEGCICFILVQVQEFVSFIFSFCHLKTQTFKLPC